MPQTSTVTVANATVITFVVVILLILLHLVVFLVDLVAVDSVTLRMRLEVTIVKTKQQTEQSHDALCLSNLTVTGKDW